MVRDEEVFLLALLLIKKYEGFEATPYHCPAGVLTIGYGHVIQSHESFSTITKDDAELLLKQDLTYFYVKLCQLTKPFLHAHQWAALLSFSYNVGLGAYQRSTLRQKVNREEHDEAPKEFLRWVWAKGKKLPGLVQRRKEEAMLYIGTV